SSAEHRRARVVALALEAADADELIVYPHRELEPAAEPTTRADPLHPRADLAAIEAVPREEAVDREVRGRRRSVQEFRSLLGDELLPQGQEARAGEQVHLPATIAARADRVDERAQFRAPELARHRHVDRAGQDAGDGDGVGILRLRIHVEEGPGQE